MIITTNAGSYFHVNNHCWLAIIVIVVASMPVFNFVSAVSSYNSACIIILIINIVHKY